MAKLTGILLILSLGAALGQALPLEGNTWNVLSVDDVDSCALINTCICLGSNTLGAYDTYVGTNYLENGLPDCSIIGNVFISEVQVNEPGLVEKRKDTPPLEKAKLICRARCPPKCSSIAAGRTIGPSALIYSACMVGCLASC